MTEHKFKIGQLVYLHPNSRIAPYQITRPLPEADGEFQYAIKSAFEDHERVAHESDLTRVL
jgi:hypothetical protein